MRFVTPCDSLLRGGPPRFWVPPRWGAPRWALSLCRRVTSCPGCNPLTHSACLSPSSYPRPTHLAGACRFPGGSSSLIRPMGASRPYHECPQVRLSSSRSLETHHARISRDRDQGVVDQRAHQAALPVWTRRPSRPGLQLPAGPPVAAVVGPPLNEAHSKAVLAKVEERWPGVPVTHLILTHHHDHHMGGIRTYAAAGATIVTSAVNRS